MSVKTNLKAFVAAMLLTALAGSAAAENARLPYRQLYLVQQAQDRWNRTHTNLVVMMVMQSTLPGVKSSDLVVDIESKSGKIPVIIGAAGAFVLPMRDELAADDAWIISNQPKGTMKLNWQIGIIPGKFGRELRYTRLMRPVKESEEIQEQMRGFFPGAPRLTMTGLRLTFAAPEKKPVLVIHAQGGDRKLEADDRGEIILPLASDLLEENPQITMSDIPGVVEIISHGSSE